VLFLIEVSDTTLAYDRTVKLPRYARARIPEVWIVDIVSETVERHTDPSPEGYGRSEKARRKETLTSITFPLASMPVDAVLGGP